MKPDKAVHFLLTANVNGKVGNYKVVIWMDTRSTWNTDLMIGSFQKNKNLETVDKVEIDVAQCEPGSKAVEVWSQHLQTNATTQRNRKE